MAGLRPATIRRIRIAQWACFGLALALVVVVAMTHTVETRSMSARTAVALALYGQADPDHVTAAGLHGLGGPKGPITLTQTGNCRFTVATPGRGETIDFSRVSGIRYVEMADPAVGLAAMFAPTSREPARARRLTVAIVEGVADDECGTVGCAARRVFGVSDPDLRRESRMSAVVTLSRLCLKADQPRRSR